MKPQKKSLFLNIAMAISLVLFVACKKENNQIVSQISNGMSGANQSMSIYPHSEEFKHTTLHGSTFLENRATCTKCHGNDYKGGSTNVSCLKCHNYPHDVKWAQPKNHGSYFAEISSKQTDIQDPLKRDLSECMMCHENKIDPAGSFKQRHPQQFVSCSTCHADVPHGLKFSPSIPTDKKPTHHSVYVQNHPELKGSCFSCHLNTDRSAPKPVDSCLNCHEGPPFEDAKEEEPKEE